MIDLIIRQDAIDAIRDEYAGVHNANMDGDFLAEKIESIISELPAALDWIPVSVRLPEDLQVVLMTWVNRDIEDHIDVAPGIYFQGHWYWYSIDCEYYLQEEGVWEHDQVDNAIEILAWMPLPEPYRMK